MLNHSMKALIESIVERQQESRRGGAGSSSSSSSHCHQPIYSRQSWQNGWRQSALPLLIAHLRSSSAATRTSASSGMWTRPIARRHSWGLAWPSRRTWPWCSGDSASSNSTALSDPHFTRCLELGAQNSEVDVHIDGL
jgi:hypothetical protein